MPNLKDRLILKQCLWLSCLMCLSWTGCSNDSSDEYQTYQSLAQSDRSGDDTVADGTADSVDLVDQASGASDVADVSTPPSKAESEIPAGIDNRSGDPPPQFAPSEEGDIAKRDPAKNEISPSENKPIIPELGGDVVSGLKNDLPAGEPELAPISSEPTEKREIKLLIPEKSFTSEGDANALRVSYDDINLLDILNMDPVPINPETYFPDWLAGLEGQRIRVRGFMYPAFQSTGLRTFVLVRDNQECCFGPGAKIYDHIQVNMREGVTSDYIQGRAFDVEGVFHVLPEADDEELYQLYILEDSLVLDQ